MSEIFFIIAITVIIIAILILFAIKVKLDEKDLNEQISAINNIQTEYLGIRLQKCRNSIPDISKIGY